jgi:hypothetical protein
VKYFYFVFVIPEGHSCAIQANNMGEFNYAAAISEIKEKFGSGAILNVIEVSKEQYDQLDAETKSDVL